ncbi:MAG: histidine kinase [Bacteroidetes bacterium]|nr:histidine kinase [Bacteroidota bacterium]
MKLSFERSLIGFFLIIIVAIVLLGAVNYRNNKSYYESSREVDHTNEVLKLNAKTLSTIQELAVRSYITTGDPALLEPYHNAIKNLVPRITHLKELTKDNADQQKRIDSLRIYADAREALVKKYLALYENHKLDAQALDDFTTASRLSFVPIRRIGAEIAQTEESFLASRKEKTESDKRKFDFSIALVFGVIALLLAACMVAVIYYITVRKKFEKNILQLNTDLEKKIEELHTANKELESFSYSVSHDLRAPLRIIDGFAKIISEEHTEQLNSEGKRFVETIRSNAQRMGLLIDDLLNFSRIGRQDLILREINMNTLVEHVIENFKVFDPYFPAEIRVESLSNCNCDEHLIQQVWINLISNALKYSRSRSKPVVEIGWKDTPTDIMYFIRDNGVGFEMEFAGKLFGVFQRLHKASDYEGTGVGLALVSRIISKHKGRIWAEAKLDQGATFYFTIPK